MPSRWIVPESGSCRVATVRISVLLPAPFGPSRPNMLLPMVMHTLLSACTPFGYVLERLLMLSAIGTSPAGDANVFLCRGILSRARWLSGLVLPAGQASQAGIPRRPEGYTTSE